MDVRICGDLHRGSLMGSDQEYDFQCLSMYKEIVSLSGYESEVLTVYPLFKIQKAGVQCVCILPLATS